jgi:antitoxin YefM
MDVVTYSDARKNFKAIMDRVVDDCDHTVITRQRGEAVVMVSLSEWNSIQETAHLLSSPKNAARLAASIAQMNAGKGIEVDWPEFRKEVEAEVGIK